MSRPNPLDKVPHCTTMAEVRSHIDAIDDQILPLLVRRTAFMTQAARIKRDANQVHDQARIDTIVQRMGAAAAALGGQSDVVQAAYRALIAASIEFEHREFARQRQGESA
ncbi:MAG: chorismate mutase [Rhodoferax sp.]